MSEKYPDPKHRPVWRDESAVWACLCGKYQGTELRFVDAHIVRQAERAVDPTIPDLDPRDVLPTTDYRSRQHHDADDCQCTDDPPCDHCGCCVHGMSPRAGCRMDAAPRGVFCIDPCGCEGRS